MEADAYWFDGVAPEPVADVDAHLNMRSALLQLTGLVTALSAIFWVPEYFMDPEDTFKLMPVRVVPLWTCSSYFLIPPPFFLSLLLPSLPSLVFSPYHSTLYAPHPTSFYL